MSIGEDQAKTVKLIQLAGSHHNFIPFDFGTSFLRCGVPWGSVVIKKKKNKELLTQTFLTSILWMDDFSKGPHKNSFPKHPRDLALEREKAEIEMYHLCRFYLDDS